MSIETKLSHEKLRGQRVSSDVRGIVFAVVQRKPCCSWSKLTLDVTVSFVCLVFWGRRVCVVSIKVARR